LQDSVLNTSGEVDDFQSTVSIIHC